VTANWPLTLAWAIFVLLTLVLRRPIWRGLFGVLATLYAVSISAGNSTTVFAKHHQFTGGKWTLVVVLDAIAAVFTVLCLVAALNWAWCAVRSRRALPTGATASATGPTTTP
jgi:hypothetical protein